MYGSLAGFLILLAYIILSYLFIRNIISLVELLRIRRGIMERHPPILVPFLVLTTRPLREILKTHMANQLVALQGAPLVYGLTLPLQLQMQTTPFSGVHMQLRKTVVHTDALSPTPCSDEREMAGDANMGDEFVSVRRGSTVLEGGPVGHSSRGDMNNDIAVSVPAAHRRRKDIFGRSTNRHVQQSSNVVGVNSGGGGVGMGAINSSNGNNNTNNPNMVGNDALGILMSRLLLLLDFRLESAVRFHAPWLHRVDVHPPHVKSTENSLSLARRGMCLTDGVRLVDGTATSHPSSTAVVVAAAAAGGGGVNKENMFSSTMENPLELRCVCFIGADDVEIMRAVTVNTTKTFGLSSLSYQCYYTEVDEANCAREHVKLLDWHNRQQLGARFHRRDEQSSTPLSRGYSLGEIVLQVNDQLSPRQYFYQEHHHHHQYNKQFQENSPSSVIDIASSPRESFDSFSTMIGYTRSWHQRTQSNIVTETFREASRNFVGIGEGSTQDVMAAPDEREVNDKIDKKHIKRRKQRLLASSMFEQKSLQKENTQSSDNREFLSAVSTLSESSWIDSSSSDVSQSTGPDKRGKRGTIHKNKANMVLGNNRDKNVREEDDDDDDDEETTTATASFISSPAVSTRSTVNWEQGQQCANLREMAELSLHSPQYVRTENNNNHNINNNNSNSNNPTTMYQAKISLLPHIVHSDAASLTPLKVDIVDLALAAIENSYTDGMRISTAATLARQENISQGSPKIRRTENYYSQQQEQQEPQGQQQREEQKQQEKERPEEKDQQQQQALQRKKSKKGQTNIMTHGKGLEIIENHQHPITLAFMLTPQTTQIRRERRSLVGLQKSHPVECIICVYSSLEDTKETHGKGSPITSRVATPITKRRSGGGRRNDYRIPSVWREMDETLPSRECEESRQAFSGNEEMMNTSKSFVTDKVAALLGAMYSDTGVEMPMELQYIRVGNDLYAVRAISDRTFVQYREERVLIGSQRKNNDMNSYNNNSNNNNNNNNNNSTRSSSSSSNTNSNNRSMEDSNKLGQNSINTVRHKRRVSNYHIGAASYSLVSPSQSGVQQQLVRMCWFCLRTQADIIFLPCAHFAVCCDCSEEMSECCICHAPIRATIRLHEQRESQRNRLNYEDMV
ncbi:hypothetical protein LSM04_007079 [Trypanosoma melophagium]|uniref:uncharacterized protein n=1 Tax=Trypanosoma melophagium TaxID=715481 RepID=UPI00351A0CAB|nr:hypothetical protein LSM04_007079 [Trypanosoma melophagium]